MSEKILVRGVNWIGDAVMSLPALKALRKACPESSISLLVKPSIAPIFDRNPDIDEIILYGEEFKGITGRLRLAGVLRGKGFSRAILFQNAFDAALIAFLAGIPERVGYNRDGRGMLLTGPIPFDNEDRRMHHTDYYLDLLTRAGISDSKPNPPIAPWIYLSLEERLSARNALSELKRPILGISPGAAYGSAKRWFPDRFAEVADWFINDTGGSVVIFGGKDEASIAEEIEKLVITQKSNNSLLVTRHSLLNLSGKTSLRELISLISECDVILSNDSGAMHIAYAVGTPLVAMFGSTDPKLTGPLKGVNVVLKADLACSPCFERTCRDNDMKCMYNITTDDVYLAIKKILPERPAVFFDRDGTLCRDSGYLNRWEDFKVFPEIYSLNILKNNGFLLIGVSNQSGVARGLVDESFAREVNKVFVSRYGFDDFYYCPHHPDEHCPCRKPEPGMLFEAREGHRIDLKASYVVGDKDSDMILAKSVGAKGIFVLTGQQEGSSHADFVAKDLRDAVDFIVRDRGL
ncbi:MAG: lipopolysaccharide heptosyltransferase II [Thermodesulfovibrionales bacterium]